MCHCLWLVVALGSWALAAPAARAQHAGGEAAEGGGEEASEAGEAAHQEGAGAQDEPSKQQPGMLEVSSEPPGAAITLDGEPLERHTPATLEVDAGEHTVALTMDGYELVTETVRVQPAGEHPVEVTLEATPQDRALGTGRAIAEPEPEPEPGGAAEQDGVSTGVWVATGVAAAGLVAGTVLGFMALTEQSEFGDMPTESRADRGERLALFADVSFGIAAASAIAGLVLYFTDGPTDNDEQLTSEARRERGEPRVDVAPAVGAGGAGGAVRLRF